MMAIKHIAFIMDGNSSWAKANGVNQLDGYLNGMRNLSRIAILCGDLGIKHATFYAFSTENWERPKKWISEFMKLATYFYENDQSMNDLKKAEAKLTLFGDVSRLSPNIQKILFNLVEDTKDNHGINVCLAVSYGGRDEIVRACRKLVSEGGDITESSISEHLDSQGIPDPDIIVRSGGKHRISNFLLWQSSYSELYFSDVFWPDFSENELQKVIDEFSQRKRTYGK